MTGCPCSGDDRYKKRENDRAYGKAFFRLIHAYKIPSSKAKIKNPVDGTTSENAQIPFAGPEGVASPQARRRPL